MRIMAIDYGDAHTGVAISDPTGFLAGTTTTIHSRKEEVVLEELSRIVREHQDLFLNGERIGQTTSGTHCPFLGKALAMGLIDAKYAAVGTALEADVRGRRVAVEIVPLPFYKRG